MLITASQLLDKPFDASRSVALGVVIANYIMLYLETIRHSTKVTIEHVHEVM